MGCAVPEKTGRMSQSRWFPHALPERNSHPPVLITVGQAFLKKPIRGLGIVVRVIVRPVTRTVVIALHLARGDNGATSRMIWVHVGRCRNDNPIDNAAN